MKADNCEMLFFGLYDDSLDTMAANIYTRDQ
jgi:hypothetical protein